MIASHDTFEVHTQFKMNYHEFTAVMSAFAETKKLGCTEEDITVMNQILTLTDTELYDNIATSYTNDDLAAKQASHWLRYKGTVLRKILAVPGDFSFLKYSYKLPVSYWLLNAMYHAVDGFDAWNALRSLGSIGTKETTLLCATPTLEQLEKVIASSSIIYTVDEYAAALRTMVYIAKHGWHHYLWRRAGGLSPLRASVYYF